MSRKKSFWTVICLGWSLMVAGSANATQTYPIVCKTGPGFNYNSRTISTNPPNSELIMTFTPGGGPAQANGSGLDPGQCSWVDRALNSGEFPFICFTFTPTFRVDYSVKYLGNNTYTGFVIGVGSDASWLTNFAQSTGQVYTFNVFNEGPSTECLRDPYW